VPAKKARCGWCEGVGDFYVRYHDEEWGVPVRRDRKHFEFLILEGAQAGLSWATILKRRDGYRKAFANFDFEKVSRFTDAKLQRLLKNPAIIRNRLKVYAARTNAKAFLAVRKEFGSFDRYAWSFVGGKPLLGKRRSIKDIPATSAESDAWSGDLKKRGFKFVGSTIVYAHMQAIGMVNDHVVGCFRYKTLAKRK
jgi:DNA-3-methyladenine glycosylase I